MMGKCKICLGKFVYLRVTTMMPTTDGKIPPMA